MAPGLRSGERAFALSVALRSSSSNSLTRRIAERLSLNFCFSEPSPTRSSAVMW